MVLTAANSSVQVGDLFTIVLADPGAVGVVNGQQTRHWLANGVTIGEGGKLTFPPSEAAITAYGGE